MKTRLNHQKWMAVLMALVMLMGTLPAQAEQPFDCENGVHVFMPNTPSTETSHDGYCIQCNQPIVGEHVPGWVDNGDGTHSAGCAVCHYIVEGTEPEPHSIDHTETIDATCDADGSVIAYCKCGTTVVQTIPALGHDVDDGVVTAEATCESAGVRTYTCRRCGQTATEEIPALGHDVDDGVVTTEATCESAGVRTYTCRRCGQTATEEIPALGHDVDDGVVTAEATCESAGVRTYTCRRCGQTATEEIPALGHDVDDGVVTTEATAESAGVKTYTCRRCGQTATQEIPALENDSSNMLPMEQPSADNALSQPQAQADPCDHEYGDWSSNGDGHTRSCAKCGDVEAASHAYDAGTVTQSATESASGAKTYTCTVCGYQKIEEIPAIPACDHEYGSWTSDETRHTRVCSKCGGSETSEHVFGEDGQADVCSICSYVRQTTTGNPACDHEFGEWTADENAHHRVCGKCHDTESGEHVYGDGTVTTPATESAAGVMTYTCSVCGHEKTETIPATVHHLSENWTAKDGDSDNHYKTCTDEGCDYSVSEPHAFDAGTVTKPATETENGVMTYVCSVCGYQKTADIPATNHHWGAWTDHPDDDANHYKTCSDEGCGLFYGEPHTYEETVTPATCKDEGKLVRKCSVCGHTVETPLEKVEHTWGAWTSDDAQHTRECSVCHEKETANHTFGEVKYDANQDADHHYMTCTVCLANLKQEHVWDDGKVVTAASPYATGLKQYNCTANGCAAVKYETLPKTQPALTDRYLYFPVQLVCTSNGGHGSDSVELAVATADFGQITLGFDGVYRVERTMTINQSWQSYFLDLAGWKGSHKLVSPAGGKVTLSAVLDRDNVWKPEAIKLSFEDVEDSFTVRFKSGDKVVETYTVKAGEKIGQLPVVNDFAFLGWYYKNGGQASENDTVNGNLTLYARYSYDVPKTGNNDHDVMLALLGVSGAMLLVMVFAAVQMIRLSRKSRR